MATEEITVQRLLAEVLSVHRRTRMGGIYPHRCRGEIQAGVYRNV